MDKKTNPYVGHRYPAEIIRRAVWLYFRFTLSFRDAEEILAYRVAGSVKARKASCHVTFD